MRHLQITLKDPAYDKETINDNDLSRYWHLDDWRKTQKIKMVLGKVYTHSKGIKEYTEEKEQQETISTNNQIWHGLQRVLSR